MRSNLILSAMLLMLSGVSPAEAAPGTKGTVLYFDGAGHIIGSTLWSCNSPPVTQGQTGPYWIKGETACPTLQPMCPDGLFAYVEGAGPLCLSQQLVNDIRCAPEKVDPHTGLCRI